MQLSETIKLYPTEYQRELIMETMTEYVNTVNRLVSDAVSGHSIARLTSAGVTAALPSALKCQCIRDANSIVKKHYRTCHATVLKNRCLAARGSKLRVTVPKLPVLKKPCCYVNNQNYKVKDRAVEFPVLIDGNTKRIAVPIKLTKRQSGLLSGAKLGTLRIVLKNRTLVAQAVYSAAESEPRTDGSVMGVDLGIKCPAVSYCSDGSVKFYGNGRRNKYMRRHYAYLRKKLQGSKKMDAVRRINDKEARTMRDTDHKISHEIIKTAVKHNVKVIKLEQLQNIRSTTRQSRKNNHNLHNWSFYRLSKFIEYKAELAGITVEYVNPAYTSQKCPVCGKLHHADDRAYVCSCGFRLHRDLVGAVNICHSTEYVGKRRTA